MFSSIENIVSTICPGSIPFSLSCASAFDSGPDSNEEVNTGEVLCETPCPREWAADSLLKQPSKLAYCDQCQGQRIPPQDIRLGLEVESHEDKGGDAK
jgi:hypothetical protein